MISEGRFLIDFMIEITGGRSEEQRKKVHPGKFLPNYNSGVVAAIQVPTFFSNILVSFRLRASLRQVTE